MWRSLGISRRYLRPSGQDRQADTGNGGFALVDALCALAILAATLAFAIKAAELSSRLGSAALETRAAAAALDGITLAPASNFDVVRGRNRQFEWQIDLIKETNNQGAPSSVCRRSAALHSVSSGRRFTTSRLQPCPALRVP
jgi:hypothetical protein